MSRRRQGRSFSRYSLSPEANSRRATVTKPLLAAANRRAEPLPLFPESVAGAGRSSDAAAASGSSIVSFTSAKPVALRPGVPLKITSCMRPLRSVRGDCSPNTQWMASLMLDLPHPFGPTTAAMPSPLKAISVLSANDLKPSSSTFCSFNKLHLVLKIDSGHWWKHGRIASFRVAQIRDRFRDNGTVYGGKSNFAHNIWCPQNFSRSPAIGWAEFNESRCPVTPQRCLGGWYQYIFFPLSESPSVGILTLRGTPNGSLWISVPTGLGQTRSIK